MPRDPTDNDREIIARVAAEETRARLNRARDSSPSVPEKQVNNPSDMVTRELALTALVFCAGSINKAQEALRDQGIDIPYQTLNTWKRRYSKEYNQIAEKNKAALEENIIRNLRETVVIAEAAERAAVEIALKELERAKLQENMRPTDAAIAANNLANIKGKAIDRLLTLTGRPSSIIETRSAEVLLRKLQNSGVMKVKSDSSNSQ